jgi:hypothetical protein
MKRMNMKQILAAGITAALMSLISAPGPAVAQNASRTARPTVVLVHGAFAGSDSWNGVAANTTASG